MDELLRKLERAACAGDELAARELGQRKAAFEGLSPEERVKRIVLARFELVLDYHTEWTPSISELQSFALRTLSTIRDIKKGDKAAMKRMAEQLFRELAPTKAMSLASRREYNEKFKPIRAWMARVRALMHGPIPTFRANAEGSFEPVAMPRHERIDHIVEAEINNVPVVEGFENVIQNIREGFIQDLERQS